MPKLARAIDDNKQLPYKKMETADGSIKGIIPFKHHIPPFGALANTTPGNDYPVKITVSFPRGTKANKEYQWPSSEHAYHAQKLIEYAKIKGGITDGVLEKLLDDLKDHQPMTNGGADFKAFLEGNVSGVDPAQSRLKHLDNTFNTYDDFTAATAFINQPAPPDTPLKYTMMADIVREKLKQDADLMNIAKKAASEGLIPVEVARGDIGSPNDWGCQEDGKGQNYLGRIILQIGYENLDPAPANPFAKAKTAYEKLQSEHEADLKHDALADYVTPEGTTNKAKKALDEKTPVPHKQQFIMADETPLNGQRVSSIAKAQGSDPRKTVFIFSSNTGHHTDSTSLFSKKSGAGLADVAEQYGKADGPTLGLPTTGMDQWDGTGAPPAKAKQAVIDIAKAIGAGYSLALPVRDHANTTFFDDALADGKEPSFWGGVESTPNKGLAKYYRDSLDDFKEYLAKTPTEQKQMFIDLKEEIQLGILLGEIANSKKTKDQALADLKTKYQAEIDGTAAIWTQVEQQMNQENFDKFFEVPDVGEHQLTSQQESQFTDSVRQNIKQSIGTSPGGMGFTTVESADKLKITAQKTYGDVTVKINITKDKTSVDSKTTKKLSPEQRQEVAKAMVESYIKKHPGISADKLKPQIKVAKSDPQFAALVKQAFEAKGVEPGNIKLQQPQQPAPAATTRPPLPGRGSGIAD